jgi:hypothetical protein
MNWVEEARRSLLGSWLLLIRNIEGYRLFTQTEAGFWRSFSAIVLIAPLYLYATTIQIELPGEPDAAAAPSFAMSMVGLVLEWVGWPLAMVVIARYGGLQEGFSRYIIAYNWSSVLVVAMLMPPLILLDLGLVGPGFAAMLSFVAMLISLYFRWFVARTALEISGLVAAALVLGDVVLSLFINRLVG